MIGTWLPNSSVVALDGQLGVGKTCFAQGVAQGLGVSANTQVTSPAYTLVQEYPIESRKLIHIDFYRLNLLTSSDYMLMVELFDHPENIILVEWASKFLRELTSEFLQITSHQSSVKPSARYLSLQIPRYTRRY